MSSIVRPAVGADEVALPILHNLPADVSGKLVEMVAGSYGKRPAAGNRRRLLQAVDRIVGVHPAVAEEFERSAMKFIGSRFGNNINHSSAGPAEFGGIAVGVDLEFLHRILRELVRSAAGAGAAQGLPEERLVVVGAVP